MTCSQLHGVVSARHWISNLLHTYVDFADRKDVDGAVGLLASTRVSFPGMGFDHPDDAEKFFAELWKSSVAHRHDVSNLVVLAGAGPRVWKAHAHYTRWVFEPDPRVHTLGEYTMVVDERDWSIIELTVTRTWTRS
ncbi:hypothetical protein [Rhodococcus sp. IEGM 1318]|uniref:hypothetical protein n=1 Tax=Rhodococcus sp. IEGM 1318 TaxID=3082226 RepID=UPI002955D223|nr:hypothetical protein [Rhodococcus sp. IEGM 1318]MDV8009268.1 hypothetical protein [Rhodococcus sp. IEGM 1318]